MPLILILIGCLILYFFISKLLREDKTGGMDKLIRYGVALVLGLLALVILVRGNIPVALVLGTGAVLSWQGSLWSYLAGRAKGGEKATGEKARRRSISQMSRAEALDILGLSGSPTAEEIRQAYNRLIKKNHPDQGGSDFLSAQINQAKDLLLGQL